MSAELQSLAQAAWLAYRDQYHRENPWNSGRRIARQMRRREFIAGFVAGFSAHRESVEASDV